MTLASLRAISWLLSFIPRTILLRAGDALGWLVFACFRFRRKVVLDNLRLAFGDTLSDKEVARLALQNYQHYGRVLIEILQSINWKAEDYRKQVVVEGLEHVHAFLERGESGFFLTCHLGNWEFAIATAAAWGIPLDIVVKQARTAEGEKLLQWYRRKTGAGIFLESGTARDILKSLSAGRFVGFILDQFMGPPIGLPVKFFGKQAGTAVAVALLTEKRNVPILPAYSFRDVRGVVHLVFEQALTFPPLSDDKDERLFQKTQFFNDVLEERIRRYPSQWLWLHRRWKPYRGVPRWLPKRALVTNAMLLGLLLGSCTTGGRTPTGIDIPADPKIDTPRFRPESGAASPAASPSSTPTPGPVVKTHKARKKKRVAKGAPPALTPTPVASPRAGADLVAAVSSEKIPFEIGEKMEIDLSWTAIPAGRATLEVKEGPTFNGRPTFLLEGNVLSSQLVDAFYHIDNSVESYIDKEGLVPYKFLVHMVESFQKKETRVSFDHVHHKAFYWAKRISPKWGNQDIDRSDTIEPHAMDMFSAIYYARVLNYVKGVQQSFPVYENGQNFKVDLLPVANELVRTKAGAFQCWKLEAKVAVNNILKPTGDTYLWLSDDSKKYLVKFESKLKYGSANGVLVGIEERDLAGEQEKK